MLSIRAAAFVILLTACSAAPATVPLPWRVEIGTSGGIAGKGVGSYAISSDGAVHLELIDGKECSTRASSAEVRRFEQLLAAASPQRWSSSYEPDNLCCDRIEYVLTVTEGEKSWSTKWIDDPLPRPADLVAVADAMLSPDDPASLRSLHVQQCVDAKQGQK